MTFLEVYNAIQPLAQQGKDRINQAIEHVDKMRFEMEPEEQPKADEAIKAALNRIADIDTMAHRLRANIHLLALTCHDNTIPIQEPNELQ